MGKDIIKLKIDNCDRCTHRNVCKYKESYRDSYKSISSKLKTETDTPLFVMSVHCKEYCHDFNA